MYHKLTVYVKGRYQTNLFPSCCFGDKYHKYHSNSVNTWQLSFIFLHTMHNNMLHRCTDGFELIFNSLSVRGSNLFGGPNLQKSCFYKFRKKPIRAFMYMHNTEQTAVWCNMKARVVFILLSFERKRKEKLTLKLRINYFLLSQSFLACLIVNIYIHV